LSETDDPQILIRQALAGDAVSVRTLVDRLSPVISRRVVATLWRRTHGRQVTQEVADMTQDVFLSLFQSDGKALRAWDPARGMTLDGFVGMLAQHQVVSILRSGRTSPWREEPTESEKFDDLGTSTVTPEAVISSREDLRSLLDRLRSSLSPRGLELFQRIIVDEEPLEELIVKTGLGRDAIYQWKSRLLRIIRGLADETGEASVSETAAEQRNARGAPPR
jgi:DNA-directed RNA polymerase specialized sigma24 family protein